MTDIVTGTPAMLAAAQPELADYCSLTKSAAAPFTGSTLSDLRSTVAGATSLFLLDDLPSVVVQEDDYGHGQLREETHDRDILPGIPTGRFDMSRVSGVDPVAATKAYLARFCDHWRNGPRLPFRRVFTDGFSAQYPAYSPQAQSQFSALPASLMEYHPAGDSTNPYGPGAALLTGPACFWECFGGGMDPSWMWTQGQAPMWKANQVRAHYCGIFGSFLGEVHQPDCLMNVAASWPDTLFVVLNYYVRVPWALFLAGQPIGRVAAAAGGVLTNLVGSPLVRLPQEVVDMVGLLSPLQAQIDALRADVNALKTAAASGTTTNAGGTIITLAHYRVVAHPEVFTDALAYVQAQAAAGKPVAATDALGDPWFGQLKELYVEGTKGGVGFSRVIAEGQAVTL